MHQQAIEVDGVTKRYGAVTAVEDLSFTAQPGRVTGFLGPNGAGKSTTLRILVGLATATAGTATFGGRSYVDIARPASVIGAQFEGAFHPGRSARDHLRVYAPVVGVDDARCDEVLAMVGMTDAARRRVGGYSLGMRQRLGLATALLGDPSVLVLDESANGLDPAGIRWLRSFLRAFADEGGTVLLSSHMLSEVEQTVDDVVIISGGRLRHHSSLDDLRAMTRPGATLRSPDAVALAAFVRSRFGEAGTVETANRARIVGVTAAEVGAAAFADGLEVHGLSDEGESLEDLFLRLTATTEGIR
ncbi:ATP-binding cassette domain-containing protein [Demequina sp. NBRC 110055]|uniref:ATP-binding cassette domain-containing protein n=1 Tax=Demequina sp. NBRC 110055 TaxID=1570344 RepID=UPI000A00BD2A|nr:ATP-binding cassette domain-containing protein [Demequina sp. NBRC 110055]